jgi:hypothetical protein
MDGGKESTLNLFCRSQSFSSGNKVSASALGWRLIEKRGNGEKRGEKVQIHFSHRVSSRASFAIRRDAIIRRSVASSSSFDC